MTTTDPAQAVAEALEVHQIEFIDWQVGWDCGCNERGYLPGMPMLSDALRHQAEAAVATARPLIEAQALRKVADDLPSLTHGGLAGWPDHDRGIYELAIEEAEAQIHARADKIEREATS